MAVMMWFDIVSLSLIVFLALLCWIFTFKYPKLEYKSVELYLALMCIYFSFVTGFRDYNVGNDTLGYKYLFESLQDLSLVQVWYDFINYNIKDPGYPLLCKIFQMFCTNYRVYLIFVALFYYSSLFFLLKTNIDKISYALLSIMIYYLLFFSFSTTGIRQLLVFGITYLCSICVFRNKYILFFLLLLLASTIHKTALLFIPFYFVSKFRYKKYSYLFLLLLFVFVFLFKSTFASILALNSGEETYLHYASGEFQGAGTPVFTCLFFLVFITVYYVHYNLMLISIYSAFYINAMSCAFLLIPLTWIDPSLMRLVMFFSIYLIFILPLAIDALCVKLLIKKRSVYFLVVVLFIVLKLRQNYTYVLDFNI